MKKKIAILGLTAIMALAVLVGCKDTAKAPEEKPTVSETVQEPVQEQKTTVTTVDPTDVGEEFPE